MAVKSDKLARNKDETGPMLNGEQKIIVKPKETNQEMEIQNFLERFSSTASIPGYMKGEHFSSRKGVINQCLVVASTLLLAAGIGQPIGYSAIVIPQLSSENSTIKIDLEMGSWIASVHSAASPIGSFIGGSLMEKMGRRTGLQVSTLPLIAGWITIYFAKSYAAIIGGRILAGLAVGLIAPMCQVYVGELAEPRMRGLLIGCPIVAYNVGVLLIYIFGTVTSWRTSAIISIILPLLSCLALSFCPESPTWLGRKRRLKKALDSLTWLRGDAVLAQKELHQLMTANEKDQRESQNLSFFKVLGQTSVLKPLIISILFNFLPILSGTFIIIFYAVDIIAFSAGSSVDGMLTANVTAIVRLLFSILTCILLFYVGKRPVAIISTVGSTVMSFIIGIYIWIRIDQTKSATDFYIIAACLLIFIAVNTLGVMMLPFIFTGEILPVKVRGLFGGYIFMFQNLLVFAYTKLYPTIKLGLGCHGMFIMFGIFSLLGAVFIYLFLPETRNKSLHEIEQYFKKSNYMWIGRKKVLTQI